jgi:hypothetical protein
MKSLLAFFFTTAALCTFGCSAGTGGSGYSTTGSDVPPVSGDLPPFSGDLPPFSGDPTSGGAGADLVCDGTYTCKITQNGKSGTNVLKLKCDSFVNGNIVEKGKVIGSYAVNFDGSFTLTALPVVLSRSPIRRHRHRHNVTVAETTSALASA